MDESTKPIPQTGNVPDGLNEADRLSKVEDRLADLTEADLTEALKKLTDVVTSLGWRHFGECDA